jgi:hypothetical protein
VTAIVVRTGHCGHTESLKRPSSSNPSHARNGTRRSARPHVLLLLLLFLFFPYFAFSGSSPPVFDNKTPFKPRHKTKMTYVSESQSFPPSPPPPPPPLSSYFLSLTPYISRSRTTPTDTSRYHATAVRSFLMCLHLPYLFPITSTFKVAATIQNIELALPLVEEGIDLTREVFQSVFFISTH